jgi:hypothetical protein
VADSWCWFVLREKYCWLVAGGWFVLREKYCWLVADKPSEQGARSCCAGGGPKATKKLERNASEVETAAAHARTPCQKTRPSLGCTRNPALIAQSVTATVAEALPRVKQTNACMAYIQY